MPFRWRGVLLREGVETGDHRLIEPGASRWRELPRDLGCVFEDGWGGHEGAIVVGTIETIERRGADVWGEGAVLQGDEHADRWVNMNRQGALRGCSVDLTGGECIVEVVHTETGEVLDPEIGIEVLWGPEGDEYYIRERWTDAEIGSTAVCRVPAFAEALIEVYDTDEEAGAEPEGGGDGGPAEGLAAGTRTFAAVEDVAVGQTVRWTDDDDVEHTGEITAVDEDNESVTVVEATDDGDVEHVVSIGQVTIVDEEEDDEGGEDGEDDGMAAFPELARRAASSQLPRPALAAMLARERGEPVTASVGGALARGLAAGLEGRDPMAGAVVQAAVSWGDGPDPAAFARRDLQRPTPFTIDDDGTVYGHLRTAGQCHMGFMNGAFSRCVTVPDSPSSYALFHANRQVRCSDGSRVAVGIIALDSGHAPAGRPGRRPSLATVQSWYEDTGTQACYVHAYDDAFGTQVCGILRDGLSVDDARRAMASSPSGDWRDYGQGLDLTGCAFVNVPGYPQMEIEDSSVTVLLACLAPPPGVELTAHEATGEAAGCDGGCGCGGTCGGAGEARSGLAGNRRLRLAALGRAFGSPSEPAGAR